MIITDMDQIREAQTVRFPRHDDIRLRFPQYVKGWVTAMYNHESGNWEYGYTETKEEAIQHYETIKMFCQMAPEVMNWMTYSEMYIYSSYGETKAKWSLYGVVVE